MPSVPALRRTRTNRYSRPQLEALERRDLMANLNIVSVQVVDATDQLISAPVVGQQLYLRTTYSSTGLTSSNTFVIRYTIGGIDYDSATITGQADGQYSAFTPLVFMAGPTLSITSIVDGANSISESNEGDNNLNLNVTPVTPSTLPSKFIFPLEGQANKDWSINNYVDVDPRPFAAPGNNQRKDYRGGPFQYDGHDAIDVGPPGFASQDAGLAVIAAASGTVTAAVDGNFDRETSTNSNPANYVVVDLGGGWTTIYYHFAAGSITVKAGDTVLAGQLLGNVGSSGNSTGPHLHFGVQYRGATVETFFAPNSYWFNPPPYQGDVTPVVQRSGINNYNPTPDLPEAPVNTTTFPVAQNWNAYYYFNVSNFKATSSYEVRWLKPDGSTFASQSNTPNFQQPSVWVHTINMGWQSAVGVWKVELRIDGALSDTQTFTVTSGAGLARIRLTQGTSLILNNRSTPLDFGTLNQGDSAPTRVFTIENLGAVALSLTGLQLPTGFSLVGAFPSSVAANSNATFTLRLPTGIVGLKFGRISFTTNDAVQSIFGFLVKGTVNGGTPSGTPSIATNRPALNYGVGKVAQVMFSDAVLTDPSATTFEDAFVTFTVVSGATSNDKLGIRNEGVGGGQIGVTGSSVTFGGITFASFVGGTGFTPLVITFDLNATLSSIQALLRNLTYVNNSSAGELAPRFVTLSYTDADSNVSPLIIRRITVTPHPFNEAPVLSPPAPDMPSINEDTVPAGTLVSDFVASIYSDPDRFQAKGIAVYNTAGSVSGRWEYSLNGGTVWNLLGNVNSSNARTLRFTDLVRFIPAANANGQVSMTFYAWDQTTDAAGDVVDVSIPAFRGGTTAYSVAPATSMLTITPVPDFATVTLVASSVNPAAFGQTVVFTANVRAVNSSDGVPSGDVKFVIDGVDQAPVTLNASGVATFSISTLDIGVHTVTAVYLGDDNFITSSADLDPDQEITAASTTTRLTASANPSVIGTSVIFTATVASTVSGSGTPTGDVIFVIDNVPQAPVALGANGTASISTNQLALGSHTIVANFIGSTNYLPSSSSTLTQQIVYNSTTTVSVSPTPTVFGQSVVFTATVAAVSPGTGTPTGQVDFLVDGVFRGRVPLVSGRATLSLSNLSVATHSVVANYLGSTSFLASSATNTHTVSRSSTAISLGATVLSQIVGQPITFTAQVRSLAPGAGTPSGSVTFFVDGVARGTVSLSAGIARLTLANLSVGSHRVTASYLQSANFNASSSGVVVPVIQPAPPIRKLTAILPAGGVVVLERFALRVVAQEANGGLARAVTTPVRIALISAPRGGALGGGRSGRLSGGAIRFGNLFVNRFGIYRLRITAGSLVTEIQFRPLARNT